MKKKLLSYLQSCPSLFKANLVRNTFLLFGFLMMSLSGFAQGPQGHGIDAGLDVILDCGETCTDLNASYLYTGQSDTYSVSSIPYAPPFPYTGLANPISVGVDDIWSSVINLPFDFCFYGEVYTKVQIGSNGIISFNPQTAPGTCSYTLGANEFIPGGVTHKNAIMLFHDINPRYGTNEIGWELMGTAPYRTLAVSFYNVPYYSGSSANAATSTFQMVMYETTNAIEFFIQSKPDPNGIVSSPINNGRAVLGIHNKTGTKGETAPGRNTGIWSATNEAWRFTPNGAPNVEFSWLDADGNVIGTDTNINVCPTDDVTTYTAQAIYTNCNGDEITVTDDVTVTLNASEFDITLDLGPDLALCDVVSHEIVPELTGNTTGATYLWSPGGETTPTITVTNSGTYTLAISKGGCTIYSSVDIGFFDNPIIDLGADIITCFQNPVILDASPTNFPDPTVLTYEWSLDGTVITGATNPTLAITQSGTYTVTVTIGDCVATDEIVVTTEGEIDLGGDQELCDAEDYEINVEFITGDPNDATFVWSTGETTQSITVTDSGTYSVEVNINNCTLNSAVVINFYETPIIDLGQDITTCDLDSVILDATPSNTYNDPTELIYEWTLNGTVITGENNPTLTIADAGLYGVTVTIGTCTSTSEINVELGDVDIDLGPDIPTCFNVAVILDASPSNHDVNDAVFEWTLNGTIIPGETDATLEVTEIGTYGVTVTVGNCTATDEVNVTNNDGNIDLGGDQDLCDAENYEITVEFIVGDSEDATFLWSTGETTQSITVTESDTYSVEVSINDCTLNSAVTINFNNTPNIDLGEDIITCLLDSVILDATPSNYGNPSDVTYEWTLNGIVLTDKTESTLEVTEVGTYGVTATFENCIATDSVTVSTRANLEVSLEDSFEICPNEKRTLTATTSEEGVTFEWFLNGSVIAGETSSTLEIMVAPGTLGTQTYSVIITSAGCTGTDSVDVRLYSVGNCVISQGISPNGDGYNDTLDLSFLNDRTGIKKLQIYNRLGTKVFEQNNYTNEWAGQTNGGDKLPTGTYFYVIDLNGNDPVYGEQHTGWIYLTLKAN